MLTGIEQNKRREGVRNIDQKPYVLLEELVDIFNQSVENNTKNVVSKKIKAKTEVEASDKFFDLSLTRDYGTLTDSNARTYLECKTQSDRLKKSISSPFTAAVKKRIGFDKTNLPDEVTYSKIPLGNTLIYAVSSKADNISYANIVDDIITYVENTDIMRTVESRLFMNLEDFNKSSESSKQNNTKDSLRPTISYLRLPKADNNLIEYKALLSFNSISELWL